VPAVVLHEQGDHLKIGDKERLEEDGVGPGVEVQQELAALGVARQRAKAHVAVMLCLCMLLRGAGVEGAGVEAGGQMGDDEVGFWRLQAKKTGPAQPSTLIVATH